MNGISNKHDKDFLPPPLELKDAQKALEVEHYLAPLKLPEATLLRVMQVFQDEIDRGLREQPSSLQMENTYIPEVPDGTEVGTFLALDLGGTNFRVILIELKQGTITRQDVKHYHISDELRLGSGEKLFGFLADCVADFVRSKGLEDKELPLGFTFSFPMVQHSLCSGNLVTWTKSFKCHGMEDQDVVKMLTDALRSRDMDNVRVVVLLNDTTGTLIAGAMLDSRTRIGVIVGTGSNGCYMERASRVQHWETAHVRVHDVAVDIEWGAFGDNGCIDFIKTEVDRDVDGKSLLAKSFTFEKYIGGKYLGEVVRSALSSLQKKGLLSAAPPTTEMTTAHVSQIEQDNLEGKTERTQQLMLELCQEAITPEDARVVQYVCRIVSNRAAQLVSICIATLLRRMDREDVAVAVDGSVFKCHPRLKGLMQKYITLLAPEHKFSLLLAEDGSGKGAALTAAVAQRLSLRSP